MPDTTDPETVGFYNREAGTYAKWVGGRDLPEPLRQFTEALPENADVLDLGCGGGWAAIAFANQGHQVTAMDASQAMLDQVPAHDNVTPVCAGFEMLDETAAYDAIWASFSLQHAPRETMTPIMGRISRALRPGGVLYIGIHEGTETLRDDLGRLYNHYTQRELAGWLAAYGIVITSNTREDSHGYDGRSIKTMHIRAQKNG